LAVNSRSMLQIMGAFASYVDIPDAHMKDHSATPAPDSASAEASGRRFTFTVARNKPAGALPLWRYRDLLVLD